MTALLVFIAFAALAQPGDATWFVPSHLRDAVQDQWTVGSPSNAQCVNGQHFCQVPWTGGRRPTLTLQGPSGKCAFLYDFREDLTPMCYGDPSTFIAENGCLFRLGSSAPSHIHLVSAPPVFAAPAFLADVFSWRTRPRRAPPPRPTNSHSLHPLSLLHGEEGGKSEPGFLAASLHFASAVHRRSPLSLAPLHPSVSGGASSSALRVYRNKFLHINPVRRVKHLKRNSGRSHVHELARERYLLHRQKDVRDYYRMKLRPHVDTCPHSQRNAAVKKPYRGVNEARKEENRRLNADDDLRDETRIASLRAFLDSQAALVQAAREADKAMGTELKDLEGDRDGTQKRGTEAAADANEAGSLLPGLQDTGKKAGEGECWASFSEVRNACEELQRLLRKRRMLRPLGSHKLFVSGVDDRLMNSDLEDFFDFFFRKTRVKLNKNPDGTHRGSGLIVFETTLDATQCLLQFNGIRIGAKRLFLAEALGPALKPKVKKEYVLPAFPFGPSAAQAGAGCDNVRAR
ncbi:putative RNA recognition motif-containing protein [Neospora caninum Liverpool]|nr:putative RNA recognition motif-containing protein [Neospora caninum Liverpool]CBZ53002.1 putative RNA recognition motif-containing protein [Neospora caninum Liverpool]|eukprot:XP_003883034.1 putative RNA recognition motif-containing protein [Neospora caninum Liverpool]